MNTPIHQQWSSRLAFILAAMGSAIGLGNIWKFPYITGDNGGGAFVLVYLICIFLIGFPIMVAEILIGRRTRKSPVGAMESLAQESNQSKHWKILGWMGIFAGFIILSYYSVIAGWTLSYIFRALGGVFTNLYQLFGQDTAQYTDAIVKVETSFLGNAEALLAWHTIFMVMTMVVVARGVKSGLETAVTTLMPLLFILMLFMLVYAFNSPGWEKGFHFMFNFRFEDLTWKSILAAMGQAFFTLSLGMGAIMVYGSYLPNKVSIINASFIVAFMDTLIAILAGLVIFPLVFTFGLETNSGPGLVFETLPTAFGQMQMGVLIGGIFFILLLFAAWTSAISLIEPAIAWLVENKGMSRVKASVLSGTITWFVGIATVLSFNLWGHIKYQNQNILDWLGFLTDKVMLPLGGLLIAIFVGWLVSTKITREELGFKDNHLIYILWLLSVRFIAPIAVLIIFIFGILSTFNLIG